MPYRYDAREQDSYIGDDLEPARLLLRGRFRGLLKSFTVSGTELVRCMNNGNQKSVVVFPEQEGAKKETTDKPEVASRRAKQIVGQLAAQQSAVELSLMLDETPPHMTVEVYGEGSHARLARTIITQDQRAWLQEDAALRK